MTSSECKPKSYRFSRHCVDLLVLAMLAPGASVLFAQSQDPQAIAEQIQELKSAMATTQIQLEQSQRQLEQMKQRLNTLEFRVAQGGPVGAGQPSDIAALPPAAQQDAAAKDLATAVDDLREQQSMQATQIATHDQTKVESESRYPVKITGLLLFNAFVNTRAVDLPATPSVSLFGPGSTGATVRQTILGFDARGPHIAGAESYADLRIDFDGIPQPSSGGAYTGAYSSNATFLRLRTVHAGLQWKHTGAYFALDRPIFNPDAPTSLTAVSIPALAWSGNLWTWNPQLGVKQTIPLSPSRHLQFEAALVDAGQSPVTPRLPYANATEALPTSAEASRWPGVDAHVALLGSTPREAENRIGIGGHVAPLEDPNGHRVTSWAATIDTHLALPAGLSFSANAYRGLALGGLGGGAYKDFAYTVDLGSEAYFFRPLDDAGGWAELKKEANQRLEFNAAFGLDNAFTGELRPYASPAGNYYQNLARNRTVTGNVILKPSAYLLFSLEYRRLTSWSTDRNWSSNVIGLGAGFKF